MRIEDIEPIVKGCIDRLLRDYEQQKENFLTEGDVTSSLYCILKTEMRNHRLSGTRIHRELRPFIKAGTERHVIKIVEGNLKWENHKPRNSGGIIDIAIVSDEKGYFNSAEKITRGSKQKYWRLLTYPLEAFFVCIEVKIRVSGNMKRIESDVIKLSKIRDKLRCMGKDCLVFLVVADRGTKDESAKARAKSKEAIEKYCKEHDVHVSIYRALERS